MTWRCRLGIHSWERGVTSPQPPFQTGDRRLCRRCSKLQFFHITPSGHWWE